MATTQFELRPVKDALIPQYPGQSYSPPEDAASLRLRRAPACISLLCIFLLSFGLMLSMASCSKDDDDGSGGLDGDMEDGEGDGESDVACTSDHNACVDRSTARICMDGRLEDVNCQEYCEENAGYEFFSDGCKESDNKDNLCGCYSNTLGSDEECRPEDSYCLSGEILESCTEDEWEWLEINCSEFCLELGKASNGCVTPEADSAYCECAACTSEDNVCIDEANAAICIEGRLEEVNCEEYCEENYPGIGVSGCNGDYQDDICGCYSEVLGDYVECLPEESFCSDADTLQDCSGYNWQEIDCATYCSEQGKVSQGCVPTETPETGYAPHCDCAEADGDGEDAEK